jgi:hypothetical protein
VIALPDSTRRFYLAIKAKIFILKILGYSRHYIAVSTYLKVRAHLSWGENKNFLRKKFLKKILEKNLDKKMLKKMSLIKRMFFNKKTFFIFQKKNPPS